MTNSGHVGVQEELDELKMEKREVKKQLQLVEGIMKEDLYTAYYAVSEDEEIVGNKEIEIPGMEQQAVISEVKRKDTSDIENVDTEIGKKMSLLQTNIVISKKNRQTYMLRNLVKWMMVIRNRFMQARMEF